MREWVQQTGIVGNLKGSQWPCAKIKYHNSIKQTQTGVREPFGPQGSEWVDANGLADDDWPWSLSVVDPSLSVLLCRESQAMGCPESCLLLSC